MGVYNNKSPEPTITYTNDELLNFLLQRCKIQREGVVAEMKKNEMERTIEKHPYSISQGKDGRWRTYVKTKEGRKQIVKSTEENLRLALYEHYRGQENQVPAHSVTLEMLFPKWIEYKSLHGASSTYLKRIKSDWQNYYQNTQIVKTPIEKLTKLTLDIWAHELIQRVGGIKKQYYNVSMIMRQVLDYAMDLELLNNNVFRQVHIHGRMVFQPVRKKPNETQVFTKQEIDDLYTVAFEDFLKGRNIVQKLAPLAVMFQFQTGVRIGELCVLRYEDIADSEIYVQRMYRYQEKKVIEYTKGHNEGRYIPLTSTAKKIIDTARKYQLEHGLSCNDYIFSVNSEPLSYYSIRKLYARYCEEIGTINKSSHKSRKTYISALIDGGVNINAIREIAGHADVQTTYNSYCYDRKVKSERIKQIEGALSQ